MCYANYSLSGSLRCPMQNDECKMQNDGIGFADFLKTCPQDILQFCILNSAFCIYLCSSQISSTAISAGLTPEIRPAWPMDMGRMAESFSWASSRRPPMDP